ncbi:MAG: GNAT family N-acetyltransferase [Gammaproteobacteria bacterium]|nr:GNAT family N-acetyltransferase [Gammaproteobacteria bacterium]MDG2337587.1 GNAT family N-acetyltransferase [Gammaproteobacteria bacterium]
MDRSRKLEFELLADRPEDVPLVIDWWRTIWADRIGEDVEIAREQLRSFLKSSGLPIHILATVDGRPVGSAALKDQELAELFPDYHYWLGSVFVEANSRGEKIASRLSQRVVEMAKLLQLPHLYLQTIDLEGGLYADLGWEAIGEFTYRDERALLMLKRL